MKCEGCSELLEEYLDGELSAEDQEQISAHLTTCADCSTAFGELTAEQELFASYDRDVEVPPFLWTRIAQHTVAENNGGKAGWRAHFASLFAMRSFTGAIAILLIAIAIGVVWVMTRKSPIKPEVVQKQTNPPLPRNSSDPTQDEPKEIEVQTEKKPDTKHPQKRKAKPAIKYQPRMDQSDVFASDLGYLDMDDQDTAKHIEQTQNLLRSIRNVSVSDGDEEIDVSYDKALSRRLLNENIVLRRDAEMKAKFPTKTLLADLEPFLIDIANLPDHARPEEVRVIKERVQKTEIVAALMSYQDRSPNNR